MKKTLIFGLYFFLSVLLQAQNNSPIECSTLYSDQGSQRALTGGAYKPSSCASNEYMRALVVFVQFEQDNSSIPDWPSGQLPNWAYSFFDSQISSTYRSETISDYFQDMSNHNFNFIADIHPNLIRLNTEKFWTLSNADVLSELNNQVTDFKKYDNWKYENSQFVFAPSNGDTYLDMLIIIYRNWITQSTFGLKGGIAYLGASLTTHDNVIINGSGPSIFGSGITTNRRGSTTYPATISVHLAHEYGHYLFGGDHSNFGLMTGKSDY